MNRDPRGFYAALHVAPDASPAEIQRSFRALMRRRHPDVEAAAGAASGGGPDARPGAGSDGGEEARRILESFSVLRNPDARAAYDAAGSAARPARPARVADTGGTAAGRTAVGRDIPVRHHRGGQPVLRVTPVRWERGPE
ncbi:DnaJ domain-containing protein [Arthrobacter sp. YAF16]|uniref:DnaJ domain-containing protein n=1 Tax=Arthrobacter sp. YAF16 TaxID=3233076 RepID=UPI003F93A28B